MKALAILVLFATPASVLAADAVKIQDFAYDARIETSAESALYRLDVPMDVYRKVVRADLGDLRVFNARGEIVPHALRQVSRDHTTREAGQRLPLFPLRGDPQTALNAVRVTIGAGGGSVNVEAKDGAAAKGANNAFIADARAVNKSLAALEVGWPDDAADFAARLDVEASDNLNSWRRVRSAAPVVNLTAGGDRLIERRIEFPATQAKFWRLAWADATRPEVTLLAVTAEPAAGHTTGQPETVTVAPVAGEVGPQDFMFDIGAVAPVDRVNLELPERNTVIRAQIFTRAAPKDAWAPVTRAGFYRLRVDDAEIVNPAVQVGAVPQRYWRVQVDQAGGGIGSGRPHLTVGWFPHELIFAARGQGPFTLAFGSANVFPAAVAYKALVPVGANAGAVELVKPAIATIGSVRLAGGESRLSPPPKAFPWKSAVLWTSLVLGVLSLGFMAYRLAREMRDTPGGS